MSRTLCICLATSALALTGCTTQLASTENAMGPAEEPIVALGDLGQPVDPSSAGHRTMYFGAGDVLGQEIFTVYVASLRQTEVEEYYATGENDFPSD